MGKKEDPELIIFGVRIPRALQRRLMGELGARGMTVQGVFGKRIERMVTSKLKSWEAQKAEIEGL